MEIIIIKAVCTIAVLGIEYWLGKTDKVEAGSLIELGINLAKMILKK